MSVIRAVPYDEVHMKVECEDGIAMELYQFFTFQAPNAKFHPLVKKGRWDGNIHLFQMGKRKLYKGLIGYLREFAEMNSYKLDVHPDVEVIREVDDVVMEKFLNEKLRPYDEYGKPIKYRDAQVRSVVEALRYDRVLLLSPTSSGKSLIIYSIIRMMQMKESMANKKVLVIVPTTTLVEQMYQDFGNYSQKSQWSVEKNVHKIYYGHEKDTNKNVVVSTWQSLVDLPDDYFKQFGAVIVDEVHGAKAESIKGILEKLTNCRYRFGLTGTLDECKTHHLVLTGLFGRIIRVEYTHKMMERGEVADLNIEMLFLKHPKEVCDFLAKLKAQPVEKFGKKMKKLPSMKYQDEMEFISQYKKRNLFIKNLALNLQGNTLILFKYVEKHGQLLYDLITTDAKIDRKVFFVHGDVSGSARNEIRAIVEKEKDAIIVASYGVFSTGISIRNIHNMILASPSKSKILVLQSIGRALRMSETKTSATVYDICDDLTYKDKPNFVLEHALERADIYAKERFKFKIHRLNL